MYELLNYTKIPMHVNIIGFQKSQFNIILMVLPQFKYILSKNLKSLSSKSKSISHYSIFNYIFLNV